MKTIVKYLLVGLCLLTLFSLSSTRTVVHGQDWSQETESSESLDSSVEESDLTTEDSKDETTTASTNTAISLDFRRYMPFAKFVNYQYQGDGSVFEVQDIIMEYMPDNQGTFQITAFTEDSATAYVYQIRDNGLFELACFENYNVVEDLRYSPEATDGAESLILPSNLAVGTSYQSGYNNENKRTVSDLFNQFSFGGYTFENVIKVVEAQGSGQFNYYFAPDYGLILVERVNNNNAQQIIQLISTQGNVIE